MRRRRRPCLYVPEEASPLPEEATPVPEEAAPVWRRRPRPRGGSAGCVVRTREAESAAGGRGAAAPDEAAVLYRRRRHWYGTGGGSAGGSGVRVPLSVGSLQLCTTVHVEASGLSIEHSGGVVARRVFTNFFLHATPSRTRLCRRGYGAQALVSDAACTSSRRTRSAAHG